MQVLSDVHLNGLITDCIAYIRVGINLFKTKIVTIQFLVRSFKDNSDFVCSCGIALTSALPATGITGKPMKTNNNK